MTLRIERLAFKFGRMRVLHDITVEARPGRITALIGPNAAGKSTLLRCAIGTAKPAAGEVMIDGQIAHRANARWLAGRVAYVPQRAVVSAGFTVRQVIELGRFVLPPAPVIIEQTLTELDLLALADRPFPQLSVGQQQRVTMARALAQLADDGHLILDEPTSAMDLKHVASTMSLLRKRADRGATVIMALHDLTLAAGVADDVWLLHDGKLVAAGPTCEVLTVERLATVFSVPFAWMTDPSGSPRLLPQSPTPHLVATINSP